MMTSVSVSWVMKVSYHSGLELRICLNRSTAAGCLVCLRRRIRKYRLGDILLCRHGDNAASTGEAVVAGLREDRLR